MAQDRIVIYKGQEYYQVGDAILQSIETDAEIEPVLIIAINKVETATVKGITRAMWVDMDDCYLKVSGFNFLNSEWFLGKYNGNI